MATAEVWLRQALELARDNVHKGGRPFGAVIVKDGEVIATGVNGIHETNDPTSHAELNAIRQASAVLGSARLDGCSVYASGQPCPMCLAAMYLTGITGLTYAYSNEEGEPYGLSSAAIYVDLARPLPEQSIDARHLPVRLDDGEHLYALWKAAAR